MANMIPPELISLALTFSSASESMNQTPIPALRIARSDAPTQPVHRVYIPTLCFVVQGAKDTIIANNIYHYGPAQYLVNSVAMPVTGQITKATSQAPYLCLVLEIIPAFVYEVVRASTANTFTRNTPNTAVYIEDADAEMIDAILRLMRTLKNDGEREIVAPLIMREIIFRLLSSTFGQSVRQTGVEGSEIARVMHAIEYIRKEFAETLRVQELADVANMSLSSFHQHFKNVTSMSPLQYQKQIRLHEARRLLMTEVVDAASAAFRVGYQSPSQFSREYARMFGLPPMSDMRRVRI